MGKYDKITLERQFKSAASLRIRKKERSNTNYTNDADYWTGGRCNWGGSHNLSEDCGKIAHSFDKIEELKKVEKELQGCTSEREFNAIKSRLTRQAEEIEEGLKEKTGSGSSMFGICIIWGEYNDFLDSKLKPLRNEVNRLKENINNQQYKYYEELKLLKLEEKKIEARMKESKRKAQYETDPDQKALLLQMIDDDGKNLEENLKKQKLIPTANLKFEPDKYVSDLIESMKKAISENERGNDNSGGSRRNRPQNEDENNNDRNGNSENSNNSSSSNSGGSEDNDQPQPNFFQENQFLILGTLGLLTFFYFYTQNQYEYD